MSTARRYRHTYAEYLELERASPLKLEFSDGEIFAMAGGTPEHGAVAMQLVRLITALLPPESTIYSSDVKVRIAATDLTTYPDLSIVCGPSARAMEDPHAITNPRFIVEVTSPSTEDYDRGDKLSQYKQLTSLEAAVLISHRRRQVTVVSRSGQGWTEKDVRGGERVDLGQGVSFEVTELYRVVPGLG
jgi:Uma2 family endonuclease